MSGIRMPKRYKQRWRDKLYLLSTTAPNIRIHVGVIISSRVAKIVALETRGMKS